MKTRVSPVAAGVALAVLFLSARSNAECSTDPCRFDFDGDGVVTQEDINQCSPVAFPPSPIPPECDANCSGTVTIADFGIMSVAIGTVCPQAVSSESLFGYMTLGSLLAAIAIGGITVLRRRNRGVRHA